MPPKASSSVVDTPPFKVGDLVLGRIKGYPPWPAKIVDPEVEAVSEDVLNSRGKREHLIKYYTDAAYNWAYSKELLHLSTEAIEKFIAERDGKKLTGALLAAYKTAQDPTEWENVQAENAKRRRRKRNRSEEAEVDDTEIQAVKKRKVPNRLCGPYLKPASTIKLKVSVNAKSPAPSPTIPASNANEKPAGAIPDDLTLFAQVFGIQFRRPSTAGLASAQPQTEQTTSASLSAGQSSALSAPDSSGSSLREICIQQAEQTSAGASASSSGPAYNSAKTGESSKAGSSTAGNAASSKPPIQNNFSANDQLNNQLAQAVKSGMSSVLPSSHNQVSVSLYLLTRLRQIGVKGMFGVPGDFNLAFLDVVEDDNQIQWYGCCNELNAAFAADGYARASGKLGVLLTTFGVGDLTAINGIAGSFAERIPILHIVGTASTTQQKTGAFLHHTFGHAGEAREKFRKTSESFTAAQLNLGDISESELPEAIDRLLWTALIKNQPVYLELPTDVAFRDVLSRRLRHDLTEATISLPDNLEAYTTSALEAIAKLWKSSRRPIAIVDINAIRWGGFGSKSGIIYIENILNRFSIAYVTTPASKTIFSEDDPSFCGVYSGKTSHPAVSDLVENSDCLLSFGRLPAVLNTGSFTHRKHDDRCIDIGVEKCKVGSRDFDVGLAQLLPRLAGVLTQSKYAPNINNTGFTVSSNVEPESSLVQDTMWPLFSSYFKEKDIVIVEGGCCFAGLQDVRVPVQLSSYDTSYLWASIGWAGAAVIGACVAQPEKRVILFIGKGSYQETLQDLASVVRYGLKPTIFVLNNNGYTIERLSEQTFSVILKLKSRVHGPNRKYNDVPAVNWQLGMLFGRVESIKVTALAFNGAKDAKSYSIKTHKELANLLADPDFNNPALRLVELHCDPMDAPHKLVAHVELSKKAAKA